MISFKGTCGSGHIHGGCTYLFALVCQEGWKMVNQKLQI